MENHNEGIRLFQLIKNKTDEQTALDAASVIQGAIKAEVKYETANAVRDVKIELLGKLSATEISLVEKIRSAELSLVEKIRSTELSLIDRINAVKTDLMNVKADLLERISSSKIQTILWIVGMSIVQLMARYFFK